MKSRIYQVAEEQQNAERYNNTLTLFLFPVSRNQTLIPVQNGVW
jgi:hypothetical protein